MILIKNIEKVYQNIKIGGIKMKKFNVAGGSYEKRKI